MLEKFYRINQAAGVNIHVMPDGGVLINACIISLNKQELSIDKKIVGLTDVKLLAKEIPKDMPVALNVTGKGVLTRKTTLLDEVTAQNFSQVLPNADPNGFYIQNFISGTASFVSVLRKQDADHWVDLLKEINFLILVLSLDAPPIEHVLPQLNFYDTVISFNGHNISLDDGKKWTDYKKATPELNAFPIKIESEQIDERLLLPYAAAFQLVMSGVLEPIRTNAQHINTAFNKVKDDRKFKAQGFAALVVFFLILLFNIFLLMHFDEENQKLLDHAGLVSQNTAGRQQLEELVRNKEQVLKDIGWSQSPAKSAMIDQVASLLPEAVTWTSVGVDAPDIEKTGSNGIDFKNNEIRINGLSKQVILVNEWLARIKTRAWVKEVRMVNYSYNQEQNTGQFSVLITY